MKRILLLLIVLFTLTACQNNNKDGAVEETNEETVEETTEETEANGTNEEKELVYESTMLAPSLWSEELKLDWNYTIYLPEGFEANDGKDYDIIYLLHGAFGNHRNLVERFPIQEQFDELIPSGKMKPTIAVFVDGFNSFFIDGKGLNVESAIVNDLVPKLEELYGINVNREHRFVGGISMGGYGAANLALKHPDLFSKSVLISPAVWYEMKEGIPTYTWHIFRDDAGEFDHELWDKNHPKHALDNYDSDEKIEFIVISGEKDEAVQIDNVKRLAEELGHKFETKTIYDAEGIHAWPYWEEAMKKALEMISDN